MSADQTSSRRLFLMQSAAAGLALAARRGTRAADSPNEAINIGVIGVHGRGAALADGFASVGGARVTHVCDVDQRVIDPVVSALASRQNHEPQRVTDMRRIFDDPQSTPWPSPRPTIGTGQPRSWPVPPASTSTSKSRPATIRAKAS